MTKTISLVGAGVAVALLAAYVVLTVTNHDANAILGALLGWLGGVSAPAAAQAVTKGDGTG